LVKIILLDIIDKQLGRKGFYCGRFLFIVENIVDVKSENNVTKYYFTILNTMV